MKKIDYETSNTNAFVSLVEKLKANQQVKEFIKTKGWDNHVVDENVVAFSTWLEKNELCTNCKGLAECKQSLQGYQVNLDDEKKVELVQCDYLYQKIQLNKHKANYLICHLADKDLLNNLDDIDLSKESEYYKAIVGLVKQWLDAKNPLGIYFCGGLGVGKSYLCSCITNALAKKGKKVAFVNMPRLSSDLKANIRQDEYVAAQIEKMQAADVLVLDDIGAEKVSEWLRDDVLYPVLDYRMESNKQTLFTSNSNLEALERRYKEASATDDEVKALRIMERIKTLAQVVNIKGESRRAPWRQNG